MNMIPRAKSPLCNEVIVVREYQHSPVRERNVANIVIPPNIAQYRSCDEMIADLHAHIDTTNIAQTFDCCLRRLTEEYRAQNLNNVARTRARISLYCILVDIMSMNKFAVSFFQKIFIRDLFVRYRESDMLLRNKLDTLIMRQ